MRSFCTIFDKNYLYQAVVLYKSLEKHAKNFNFYALCMDELSFKVISNIKLPYCIPIISNDILDDEIRKIKENTTHGQFCWVSQPLLCEYILDQYNVEMVTYLEADSMFFADPEILFEELGELSISLVPHSFTPKFDQTNTSGIYCVQFNAFKNNKSARDVLEYWKNQCFEYNKNELYKYPGQMCLDNWENSFDSVKVINHGGAGVAGWNVSHRQVKIVGKKLYINNDQIVFYHYHQYKIYKNGCHDLGLYPLNKTVVELVYKPYSQEIENVKKIIYEIDPLFDKQINYKEFLSLKKLLSTFSQKTILDYFRLQKRKIRGIYNIYSKGYYL
jgi:hypothetical protein